MTLQVLILLNSFHLFQSRDSSAPTRTEGSRSPDSSVLATITCASEERPMMWYLSNQVYSTVLTLIFSGKYYLSTAMFRKHDF